QRRLGSGSCAHRERSRMAHSRASSGSSTESMGTMTKASSAGPRGDEVRPDDRLDGRGLDDHAEPGVANRARRLRMAVLLLAEGAGFGPAAVTAGSGAP